ncbi:MAG: EAL domain-containing protein [Chloroflexota bacterium]
MREQLVDTYVHRQLLMRVIGTLGTLAMQYQPVFDLTSGQVRYYEALLRIESANNADVRPASFLVLLEQLGLMRETTYWVAEHVLADLAANPGCKAFVNASPASIGDGTLIRHVADLAGRLAIDPGRLGFEVPYRDVAANYRAAAGWLADLRAVGFATAIDHCSHGDLVQPMLRMLPIEYVKSSLTPGAEIDQPEVHEYAVAIAGLAAAGKRVAAVGIEDEQALAAVRSAGFHCGQGYVFGQPQTALGPHAQR